MTVTKQTGRPFLKWAGGKSKLLPQLGAALPPILHDEQFTYVEPFVGGGAMLFHMLHHYDNITKVVINDINSKLSDAYTVIKNRPSELVAELRTIEREYKNLINGHQKEYYLSMRRSFNGDSLDIVTRVAIMLFLNRTCFNGLYRENSKGQFNVPFGRYTNPTICNEELIYADSHILNQTDVTILNGDFTLTANAIGKGLTFFYFDPPYRPLSTTSNFNSYVKEDFNDKRQGDLANFCRELANRDNVLWMLSNSDCSSVNPSDTFFETTYQDFHIRRVYATRAVNAIGSRRGRIPELLITNY